MPTLNPRVHTVLEPPLYQAVELLAKREGVSLSQKVRDLVRDSIELIEDKGLELIVEERRKAGSSKKWLSLADAKKRLKLG